jgi:hypothetical protein
VETIKQLKLPKRFIEKHVRMGKTKIQARLNGRLKQAHVPETDAQLQGLLDGLTFDPAADAIQDSGGDDARDRPPAVHASKFSAYKCRGAWARACDKPLLMDQGMYNVALCDTGTTHCEP